MSYYAFMTDALSRVPLGVQEAAAGLEVPGSEVGPSRMNKLLSGINVTEVYRKRHPLTTERIAAGWIPPQRDAYKRLSRESGVMHPEAFHEPAGLVVDNIVYLASSEAPQS